MPGCNAIMTDWLLGVTMFETFTPALNTIRTPAYTLTDAGCGSESEIKTIENHITPMSVQYLLFSVFVITQEDRAT